MWGEEMNKKLIRIAGISVLTSFLFCLFPIGFIAFEGVTHAETEEIRINFQDNLLQVPDGYIPDFGEEYGEKNGYQYGWSANNRDNAAHRGICDDPRLDSLCTIKENATWDFGLASGYYYVTVSVGDAVYGSGQTVELDVEGVPFFRDAVLEAGDFLQETKRVAVADGKLTIRKANQQSNIPVNYVHITPEQDPVHSVRLEMYNANRTDRINTIFPWYKLYNTGNEPISLEDVKIRYYYTIDGEKPQNFWCDWSDKGKDNITGMFVKLGEPFEGATHYFEAGFLSGAGTLGIGESVELHLRIAKTDWTDYIQSNDYSFNVSATGYVEWEKVCVYISGVKVWGQEIQAPVSTPTATSLSPPTVTPESTSTPTTTPELTSTPTPTSSPESTPESTPTTSPTSSPTSSPSTTPTTTPTASPSSSDAIHISVSFTDSFTGNGCRIIYV